VRRYWLEGPSKCEKLDLIPARFVVVERLDERVACPKDDTIVSAPTPPAIAQRAAVRAPSYKAPRGKARALGAASP